MRPTSRAATRAAAVAAVALLSACGSDEDSGTGPSDGAPASGSATASAAETSEPEAPQGDSEFCTQSQELLDRLGSAFTDQDPASVGSAFQQAADGFRSVEPPDEIADDWTTLSDGLEEFAAAYAGLDPSDRKSVAAFQQRTSSLQGEVIGAATTVETYLDEQCGIDTGAEPSAAGSAAPSS